MPYEAGPPNYGLFANLPCNAWVWCPLEHEICFEPDAHTHHAGDCWLKFTEVRFGGMFRRYHSFHTGAITKKGS